MRGLKHVLAWWMAAAGTGTICRTQPLSVPVEPEVVLSTRFLAPVTYEAALTRLGTYYQEQVGRILPLSFPEIGPRHHFEVWHDIWVSFDPAPGGVTVTLRRPTEGVSRSLVKTWMLDLAGRLEAAMPVVFKVESALHRVESEIFASHRDLARALQSEPGMKEIPTWEHAGLMVSSVPLLWVVLAPTGQHGVHRVTVGAESVASARQIMAKLLQEAQKPGIYAAYSEEAELDQEVHDVAGGKSAVAGVAAAGALYVPNIDEKYLEGKVRAEPEMMKRTAAALGQYAIRLRVDKPYHKITVQWSELAGYARPTGKYEAEHALGHSELANPKLSAMPLTARTRLPVLQPGAYRILVEADDSTGQTIRIDQRTYWFNGKTFEEL